MPENHPWNIYDAVAAPMVIYSMILERNRIGWTI